MFTVATDQGETGAAFVEMDFSLEREEGQEPDRWFIGSSVNPTIYMTSFKKWMSQIRQRTPHVEVESRQLSCEG